MPVYENAEDVAVLKNDNDNAAPESEPDISGEAAAAWKDFLGALFPYLNLSAENCVRTITKSVMALVMKQINEENWFAAYDEGIFECCGKTMDRYYKTVNEFNQNLATISDIKISEIINGICSVLSAQIKQHEEYCGFSLADNRNAAAKNPVKSEKERLTRNIYGNISRALQTLDIGGCFNERPENPEIPESPESFCLKNEFKSCDDAHKSYCGFLYNTIAEKYGRELYKSYSSILTEAAAMGFDEKSASGYFYETLKQEKENLESIVKVQVSALLSEIEGNNAPEEEKNTVYKITGLISEALSYVNGETERIDALFKELSETGKKSAPVSYESFMATIEENVRKEYTKKEYTKKEYTKIEDKSALPVIRQAIISWIEKRARFMDVFTAMSKSAVNAASEASSMPYRMFLYEARKSVTDKLILTDEMINGFKVITLFYDERGEQIKQCGQFEIISGIHESIALKLEILTESRAAFEHDATAKISEFVSPVFSKEDERILLSGRLDIWLDKMIQLDIFEADYEEKAIRRIQDVLNEMVWANSSDFDAKVKRKIDKESDEIKKLELSFLKDYVLYEMGTFEEILTYSVSKLKLSMERIVSEYAAHCEELSNSLVELLKRHGIYTIAPEPYSLFNSAEHEVLVAEKNEGYKKGQIIKLMNSGYKYNDFVLVRANVIAAK